MIVCYLAAFRKRHRVSKGRCLPAVARPVNLSTSPEQEGNPVGPLPIQDHVRRQAGCSRLRTKAGYPFVVKARVACGGKCRPSSGLAVYMDSLSAQARNSSSCEVWTVHAICMTNNLQQGTGGLYTSTAGTGVGGRSARGPPPKMLPPPGICFDMTRLASATLHTAQDGLADPDDATQCSSATDPPGVRKVQDL